MISPYDILGVPTAVTTAQTGGVQDDYVLGEGDEIIVDLRGQNHVVKRLLEAKKRAKPAAKDHAKESLPMSNRMIAPLKPHSSNGNGKAKQPTCNV